MIRTTIAIVAFFSLAASQAFAGSGDKQLDLYWIDVEGGAATLLLRRRAKASFRHGQPRPPDPDIVKVAGRSRDSSKSTTS
jgi:hypothetical protein